MSKGETILDGMVRELSSDWVVTHLSGVSRSVLSDSLQPHGL